MTYLRKIAFLVHTRSLLDHWYQIFLNLDKNKFDILVNDKNEYNYIRNHNKYNKFNIVRFDLSGELKKKYILSISPHFNGGTTSNILYYRVCKFFLKLSRRLQLNKTKILREFEAKINLVDLYVPLKIGIYNYRFSYGADIGEWETHLRNNFYDGFFIHGPLEKKIYRNYFKNKKYYKLGYPRYHNFFSYNKTKIINLKKKFTKDKRKIILYMPTLKKNTHGSLSSLDFFIKNQKNILSKKYFFIIKLHPLDFEFYKKIHSTKNVLLIKEKNFENYKLFLISDYVMCDFGGTPFGACYLNKKIIFLNTLNKKKIQSIRSNNLLTRNLLIKNLKNFFNLKSADVALFIKNTNWLNQKNKTNKIRKKVFYDQKIVNPKTVSNQIKEILKIKVKKIGIKKIYN